MSYVARIRLAVVAAGALSLGVVSVTPSDALALAFTPGEQRCRDAMALGASKLAQAAAKAFNRCHQARSSGSEPAATDCNDTAQVDDGGKIAAAQAALTERVNGRCVGESPDFLHYASCPAPCNTEVAQIDDFGDAAQCLACMVLASGEQMSANTQGSPTPPLASGDLACHTAIGKVQTKYLSTVLKEKRRCQKSAERAGSTSTGECDEGADPRGKIAAARQSAIQKILASCGGASVTALDSCTNGTTQQLADCVAAEAELHGESVFQSSYALPPGSGGTTTTSTSTTITTTTSTTLPPQDPQCPEFGEVTLLAGTRGSCTTNGDCEAGTCDTGLGRCRTASELDTGWTGISHDADVTDGVVVRAQLRCGGPFDGGSGEPCGQCTVVGLDPSNRACRCANDNQAICDEPFAADADDCGGNTCNCYLGPPLALSAGNTHVCVVNRFRADITGTVNVDTGTAESSNSLAATVHLGEALTKPCPICAGDVTPQDGVRNGMCQGGPDNGTFCDVDAFNTTFPAPTGGGHSLDCFPSPGSNISGAGLKIDLDQTTGTPDPITADIPCFFNLLQCHCMVCSNDATVPCDADSDCTGGATCTRFTPGANTQNNACDTDSLCNDAGNEEGTCNVGPDDKFCDGVTRANGEGFVACNANADCEGSDCGVSCGACTLVKRRECFLTSVEAQGTPSPDYPIGVSTFCIAPTANQGVNATAGLPGPGRIINQQRTEAFCASNPSVPYQPGVGGCP